MKALEMKSLLSRSLQELIALRNNLKKEYFDLRVKLSLKSLHQTHLLRVVRKNIARINTVIQQRLHSA